MVKMAAIALWLLLLQLIYKCVTTEYGSEEELTIQKRHYRNIMRCSRRFNPGNCGDASRTVWTYSWQLQNCTERMGCLVGVRGNRFRTYFSCRRNCHILFDVYTRYMEDRNPTEMRVGEIEKLKLYSNKSYFPAVAQTTISHEDLEVDYQVEDREAPEEDPEQVIAKLGLGVVDVDRH